MSPRGPMSGWRSGETDMRRGMNGLALQVNKGYGGPARRRSLCFPGKRGDLLKILWHDGLGMSLYAKRLERGRFIWPTPSDGMVAITAAQLGYMLDGVRRQDKLVRGRQ